MLCPFDCKLNDCECKSFCLQYVLVSALLSAISCFFFAFVIAKSMMQFFVLLYFAVFGLCSYVFTRLFVYLVGLFFCVLALNVYSQGRLIFFYNGCTISVIVFFEQIIHFCTSSFLQVFSVRVSFSFLLPF